MIVPFIRAMLTESMSERVRRHRLIVRKQKEDWEEVFYGPFFVSYNELETNLLSFSS